LVDWDHPVIWEVLINDLSHLRIFLFQDLWDEREEYEDDLGLLGEGD
jgi:hypothetical protein